MKPYWANRTNYVDLTKPPYNSNYGFATSGLQNYAYQTIADDGKTATTNRNGSGQFATVATKTEIIGKRYCEIEYVSANTDYAASSVGVSVFDVDAFIGSGNWNIFTSNGGGGLQPAGKVVNGSRSSFAGASHSPGDVIGIAIDRDSGKFWASKNGVWLQGDPAAGTGHIMTVNTASAIYFAVGVYTHGGGSISTHKIRPGAIDQQYSPPAGFLPYQSEA